MHRKTDIYDLGYIYFSIGKENEAFMNRDIDNKFAGNYFLGGIDFFLRFFYYFVKSPFSYQKALKRPDAVMIYGESVNNRNTLLPIIERLDDNQLIDLFSHRQFPKWRMYWYAIPHLFEFIREIKKNSQEKRDTIKNFFAKFWMMYGSDKAAGELLDYYRPKALVLANDHLPFHRSMMHEANRRGIPTIYVQHAAVTEKFPPLSFTYSFLDGEDSFRKYKQKTETSGNIYLSGGIRFDVIKNINKFESADKTTVGVAINMVDDEGIVKNVCLELRDLCLGKGHLRVLLRPHPQMHLDVWRLWCEENGIEFSNSKEETSFNFINRINVLVSNQSSIHLDAAMCHTPSVVYGLSKAELVDSYSFVKNGLCRKVNSIEELKSFITESGAYQAPPKAVKYYNCSYGAVYEGMVATMIADLIKSIPDRINTFNEKYHFGLIESDEKKRVYAPFE